MISAHSGFGTAAISPCGTGGEGGREGRRGQKETVVTNMNSGLRKNRFLFYFLK
jgi:hypothetical protein